jgi:choline dehydrogenase
MRDAVRSHWHHTSAAKMDRDGISGVDARLEAYGLKGLWMADASINTGKTVAPCVVIGKRSAELIRAEHAC